MCTKNGCNKLDHRCTDLCHIKDTAKLLCNLVNNKIFLFQKNPPQNRGKTLLHTIPVNLDSLLK